MATVQQVRQRLRDILSDGEFSARELRELREDPAMQRIIDERGNEVSLEQLLLQLERWSVRAGEPISPSDLQARVNQVLQELRRDAENLQHVRQQLSGSELGDAERSALETARQSIEARMQGVLSQSGGLFRSAGRLSDLNADWFRMLGMDVPDGAGGEGSTFLYARAQVGHPGTTRSVGSGPYAGGARAMTMGPALPATWGAQRMGSAFPSDAFIQSQVLDDFAQTSFDEVLKNQRQGQHLAMAIHRAMARAQTGDLGEMYQFCRLLTHIVARDKGKQLTDYGMKVLQLQDEHRKWTNKLLGHEFNANDPNANTEFTKLMTQVKAETDSIATSQKLLAQTMEETTVVIETMTGVMTSARDAWARVMRRETQSV